MSKSISLTPSLTCTHLRFLPFQTFSSTTSFPPPQFPRMAAESSSSSSPSAASAIDFLSLCHRLKTTKREGWVRRQVENPESISDHMYRMGLMALISADIPEINRDKCIKMAIVHDIAEAIVGDITPDDGIPKHEKNRREREALEHMCKLLGGGQRAKEIADLWMEYEENSTPEAKIVKDFDKVEMILQALEYEKGKATMYLLFGCSRKIRFLND
ncbi:Hypothetical predicted protein [Olea europaea subsp. europaea]|uniref:5'-deoxynucleotidase n=1 Tax=Olea europaea subsp. europaea TaxID=158383 RepID=A0A8S0SH14_OLEEU|nr:Hypothetical predicted protein [Olea europaea subsp. europaea]